MANITEKIERRITVLEGKIDALSGNYLTNTWKRQREQQERDRKKEMYRSQIQVLQLLKHKSETDTLTLHVKVIKERGKMIVAEGVAMVGEEKAAQGIFTCAIGD